MGCRSDAAFSTIPAGRIWAWQSRHCVVGCGSPAVVSAGWNWPFAYGLPLAVFVLVWQCQHLLKSGLFAGPGFPYAGIAVDVWSISFKSVADVEVVLVTRLFVPERCRAISVTVTNWEGEPMSVAPGYPWPPCQSPLFFWVMLK